MAPGLKPLLVCLSSVIIDIGAGILAVKAEKSQSKEVNPCNPQSKTPAYKFGFGAAALMLVAFIITDIFTDRPRFRSRLGPARKPTSMKVASVTYILAWAIFVLGVALIGAATSAGNPKMHVPCSFSKHHSLAIGGVLCFTEALVCVPYHVSSLLTATPGDQGAQNEAK